MDNLGKNSVILNKINLHILNFKEIFLENKIETEK